MKIAIIGLGYVGLPLSMQFAQSGVSVLGLDIDPVKIKLGFLSLATTVPALVKEYRETGKLNLVVHTITTINDSLPYTKTDNITLGGGKPA